MSWLEIDRYARSPSDTEIEGGGGSIEIDIFRGSGQIKQYNYNWLCSWRYLFRAVCDAVCPVSHAALRSLFAFLWSYTLSLCLLGVYAFAQKCVYVVCRNELLCALGIFMIHLLPVCADHTPRSLSFSLYVILTHTPYRDSNGPTAVFTKKKKRLHTQTHSMRLFLTNVSKHTPHLSLKWHTPAYTQPVHPSHTNIPPLVRSYLFCTYYVCAYFCINLQVTCTCLCICVSVCELYQSIGIGSFPFFHNSS